MKVLSSGCYKGSRKYNGDIIGIFDNMWYVIDGSTAVFNDNKFFETSDLYEYMQLLNKNISSNEEVKDNLKKAINESNKKLVGIEKYFEYELPTFTIAVVKECEDKIGTYQLCDTLISILYKDGDVENIEDRRIDSVKNVCRSRRREIIAMQDISDEERKKLILENEQVTRKKVNIENGFPVGSTKLESIEQGITRYFDKGKIDKILICSDGLYDSEEILPKSSSDFEINNIENRVKEILTKEKRDDLSYILIEI